MSLVLRKFQEYDHWRQSSLSSNEPVCGQQLCCSSGKCTTPNKGQTTPSSKHGIRMRGQSGENT